MIASGMVYATAVGLLIFLAAIAGSAALRRCGRPERGVWLVALGLAVVLPVAFLISPLSTSTGASTTRTATGLISVVSGIPLENGILGLPAVVTIPVEPSGLGLDGVLALAWLLASLALALRWAVASYRLARAGRSWRSETVDGVRVWLTSDLGPAVAGVLRTRILVPRWLVSLPQAQRSLVLLHEEEHVRAKDPALLAISRIARIVIPWNPVVWGMSSRLLQAVELDCDRRVLLRRPDIGTYGDTLLAVSARDSGRLVAAAAFAESGVPLHKRIVAMTTPPRGASALGVLSVLALGVVLVIGSCEVPVPIVPEGVIAPRAVEPKSQDQTFDVFEIHAERDGSVRMNGVLYPMASVSAVVGPLQAASDGTLVVSIVADRDVSYQLMDQLQKELVEADVVRVVFEMVDPPTPSVASEDVSTLWDQGLSMALRAVGALYEGLESLATRSAPSDVAHPADRGLAIVLPAQLPEDIRIRQRNLMHLRVLPDGRVEVRRGDSQQVQTIRARDVGDVWRKDVAQNDNLIAEVGVHPDAPHRFMMDVLDALQSADAERISLRVLEPVAGAGDR